MLCSDEIRICNWLWWSWREKVVSWDVLWHISRPHWWHLKGELCVHFEISFVRMKLWHIFQKGIDLEHTSIMVTIWIKASKVNILEWPSQNPDLNPIEHLGAELKRRVCTKTPTHLNQLHKLCRRSGPKFLLCGAYDRLLQAFYSSCTKTIL